MIFVPSSTFYYLHKKHYMLHSTRIAGLGFYVPERVVKNDDLTQYMETSDTWIQERTGIKER